MLVLKRDVIEVFSRTLNISFSQWRKFKIITTIINSVEWRLSQKELNFVSWEFQIIVEIFFLVIYDIYLDSFILFRYRWLTQTHDGKVVFQIHNCICVIKDNFFIM